MLLATALALLITGCAQQTFTVQNKPTTVTRKPSPSFLRFWNWAEETVDAAKICGGAENVVKNRNPANIRKWIYSVLLLERLYPLERVCIAHNNCMSCPSIWATLHLLSLIYFWVPSSCFCIVISLSLRVK